MFFFTMIRILFQVRSLDHSSFRSLPTYIWNAIHLLLLRWRLLMLVSGRV